MHNSPLLRRWLVPALTLGAGILMFNSGVLAQEASPATAESAAPALPEVTPTFTVNNVWMMLSMSLVFIMHLGFAMVESGLCRAKNCVNILTKNTAVPLLGILLYAAIGFNLMYPTKGDEGFTADGNVFQVGQWLAFAGFGVGTDPAGVTPAYSDGYTYWTDFIFQAMFAATCATIVSGAVAERIKLWSFMLFTVVFVGVVYPWLGSWKWGGGWLDQLGFYDFAGSTIVHAMGGFAALAGVIVLGPRIGKYRVDGSVSPIPGHSMPLATIGVFLLFLGWFGFNGGSVLSADPGAVSLVLVTTAMAAAAGGLAAMVTSQLVFGKPDLSMALNGILAGLVGITAGADLMLPMTATIIGLIAGVLVVFSVIALDKLKLDDPVGAISVHGVCGFWGTIAVGIFGDKAGGEQFVNQLIGFFSVVGVAFVASLVVFLAIKYTLGLRVSEAEELEGLDIGEHGMEAYHGITATTA